MVITFIGFTNAAFGALYLLPVPGFAGWYLLINNLNYKVAAKFEEKRAVISIVFLLIIVFGFLNFYFKLFASLFLMLSSSSLF